MLGGVQVTRTLQCGGCEGQRCLWSLDVLSHDVQHDVCSSHWHLEGFQHENSE